MGRGYPFTLLHAFADYVDADGAQRAAFVPGALNWHRGVSVDSSSFLPLFERAIGSAKSSVGEVDFEVHLDNSTALIYSADFNPIDIVRRRGDLIREAMPACGSMEKEDGGAEMGDHPRDFLPDSAKKVWLCSPRRLPGRAYRKFLKNPAKTDAR